MVIVPPRHYVVIENPVVKKQGVEDPLAVVRSCLPKKKMFPALTWFAL